MKDKISVKNIGGVLLPAAIYFAIQVLVLTGANIILVLLCQNMELENPMETAQVAYQNNILLLNLVAGIVAIPIFCLLYRNDYTKAMLSGKQKKYENVFFLKYLLIIPFGLFSMIAVTYLISALSAFMPSFMTESYEGTREVIFDSSITLQILTTTLMAPIVEELVFRGLIYRRIKRMSNYMIAAIISSLIFGVYHWNWIQAPYAFIIGLLAVFVYEKYKSIFAPILFHASANLFSVVLSSVSTNVSEEALESQGIGNASTSAEIVAYVTVILLLIGASSLFASVFGIIIHKTVHPKKVLNSIE